MVSLQKEIEFLYTLLDRKNIITEIDQLNHFFDEPRYSTYSVSINLQTNAFKQNSNVTIVDDVIASNGTSFLSSDVALYKSLTEALERFSLYLLPTTFSAYGSYKTLKKTAHILNPRIFTNTTHIEQDAFQWTEATNLLSGTKILLPSQAVYLTYRAVYAEEYLSGMVSTGAAVGTSEEDALLAGLYEVVERDALMTHHLLSLTPPRVQIETVDNALLQEIIEKCRRYKIEPYIFNITTDLAIPTFLTLLIDKSGVGPSITAGAKASFDSAHALIGSIEEACSIRPWIRHEIMQRGNQEYMIHPHHIGTFTDRLLYWFPLTRLRKLTYLLQQKPTPFSLDTKKESARDQMQRIKKIFLEKKKDIFTIDLTPDYFRQNGYYVNRVIIPSLQPLYFDESNRDIRYTRLTEFAAYKKLTNYHINDMPHFFL